MFWSILLSIFGPLHVETCLEPTTAKFFSLFSWGNDAIAPNPHNGPNYVAKIDSVQDNGYWHIGKKIFGSGSK